MRFVDIEDVIPEENQFFWESLYPDEQQVLTLIFDLVLTHQQEIKSDSYIAIIKFQALLKNVENIARRYAERGGSVIN